MTEQCPSYKPPKVQPSEAAPPEPGYLRLTPQEIEARLDLAVSCFAGLHPKTYIAGIQRVLKGYPLAYRQALRRALVAALARDILRPFTGEDRTDTRINLISIIQNAAHEYIGRRTDDDQSILEQP